ncbi:MAG TPA: PKD domain-containing protein [Bacteroidia bacterium]|nr:PKD domain-containing protein [Bacteroidia bacterium]
MFSLFRKFLFLIFTSLVPGFALAQAGKHGAKIISGNSIVNEYTVLTANALSGSTSLTVSSSSLNASGLFNSALVPGDLLFIIQVQGAQISFPDDSTYGTIQNYNSCGNNEFVQVASVPGANVINLSCPLKNDYSAVGVTQVLRVPRYTTLTVNSTGMLTCPSWNGATGGVLAVEVQGNTVINAGGTMDVSGRGFRGGALLDNAAWWGVSNYVSTQNDFGAEKGESIAGNQNNYNAMSGRYSKGAPANGGGGANSHNGGGGGGANAGTIGSWTGRGNPDVSNAGWIQAWNLEYSGFAASTSSGGGKGGYTFSSSNQNATLAGPGNSLWGGDQRGDQGGRGGRPLDYSNGKIFFGGGGGSGDQNNNTGGAGGNGGGIVYLLAYGDVSGGGTIRANGNNGFNASGTDGAGGGGGGGVVMVPALGNISGISISANGGGGGTQTVTFGTLEAEGPGGGGGGGYIAVSNGAIGKSAAGGQNGTTNSFSLSEFPPNGATKGGSGNSTGILPVFKINVTSPQTVCTGEPATLSFTTTGTPPAGTNLGWYSSSIGGTLLASGTNYTTPPILGTTIVYVGSCPGVYRQPILLNANQLSCSFTSSTVCQGSPTVFSSSANSSMGNVTSWLWDFGNGTGTSSLQNPSYSYPQAGTYTVQLTVTDDIGCTSTSTNSVIVNPRPTISFSATPASGCLPMNVQFTNSSTNGGSYTWNFGDGSPTSSQTNPAHIYSSSGSYSVTLSASNASGCTSSQTISNLIQASSSPLSVFNASATSVCLGDTVRFFDASLPNGTTITTRSWDFGDGSALSSQTNPSHAYLTAGTYQVRLTVSSATCSHDTSMSIQVNPGPVVNFSSSVNVGCNPLSVVFANTTSGAPVYSWNFGDGSALSSAVSPSHTYANSGTYSVTLIATQGSCADTLRIQSMIVVYPTPGASFNSTSGVCLGDTVFFTNNSTSNGGITGYSWDFGDGSAISNSTSPHHVYSSPGSYQVTLSCSTNQCVDDTVKTIVVEPAPQVAFSPSPGSGCTPLNVSFSNTTTGSPTFNWNFGDGGTSSLASPSHTYVNPGSYSVTLIATQGTCADTLTQTNLITVRDVPTASFSGSTQLCLGDTLFLQNNSSWNGAPSGNFIWDFGDGSATSNVTSPYHIYQTSGSFNITLNAIGGSCSDDTTMTVQVAPEPQALFSALTTNVCLPGVVPFNNSTAGSPVFTWDFGDGSPPSNLRNPIHTYTNPGVYTVRLIATLGSCADTTTTPAMINVLASPLADFSFSSPCVNDSVQFSNLSQAQGSTITSYTWNFGDGSPSSSLQNEKHAYAGAGTYSVSLTVQSSNGCADTITKVISVLARPVISFTPDITSGCDSLQVQFTNTSSGGAIYKWQFGDGDSSSVTSPSHTYSSPGSYTILLTAEATGGCSSSRAFVNMIIVRQSPIVQFSSSQTTICPGECIRFQDMSSSGVTDWSWSFPGANPSAAANSSPSSVCYAAEGVYDVELVVSDGFCSNSKINPGLIHVVDCSAIPIASFVVNDSSVCGGVCLSFVSLSLNATEWNWSFPGATPSSSSLESPQNICYNSQGIYPVSLIVGNASGTDTLQVNNLIQVFPAVSQPTISQNGDTLYSSPASSYQWYLNGIPISGANDQIFVAPLTGNYSVEISDLNGCSSQSVEKFVSLVGINEQSKESYLYVFPNPCDETLQLFVYSTGSGINNIRLYDALGKSVIEQTSDFQFGENKILVNTSALASGIYLLEVQIAGRTFIRRVARK